LLLDTIKAQAGVSNEWGQVMPFKSNIAKKQRPNNPKTVNKDLSLVFIKVSLFSSIV